MRLRGIPISDVTAEHLTALIEDGVPESRTLDYKAELPGGKDDEKRKFLADVIALANTSGGIIVYGMETHRDSQGSDTGIPKQLRGLEGINVDKEKLRLAEVVQRGIAPALGNAVAIREVEVSDAKGPMLLLGVPASFIAPHMITFQQLNRFYRRSDAGNYMPDVGELRRMFNENTLWTEEAEHFRAQRFERMRSAEVADWLNRDSPTFFHILPLGRLDSMIDLSGRYRELLGYLYPPGISGANGRYNVEGLMGFHQPSSLIASYTQLFRFGGLEGYDSGSVRRGRQPFGEEAMQLNAHHILRIAMDWFPKGVHLLSTRLDVTPPYALGLAMFGVSKATIPVQHGWEQGFAIETEQLVLPLVVINDQAPETVREALWPLFDVAWQSAGHSQAPR